MMRALLVGATLASVGFACAEARAQLYQPNGDIWKYRIPAEGVRGEFENGDVMGVIAGRHIRTDCSVNVVKGGKTYCFTAAASQTFFRYAPNTNLARAYEAWERMRRDEPSARPSQ